MKLELISYGTYRDPSYREIAEDFQQRITRYLPFSHRYIDLRKKYKSEDPDHRRLIEAEALENLVQSQDMLVLLDERGKAYRSLQLADQLERWMLSGKSRIIMVIGGAYGFHDRVSRRADHKISMSAMTFNHQIARIMWLEQLYRACTIRAGSSYHNE